MGIGRHRRAARVRTGLLGASSALALGVVGVTSGVLPGPGGGSVDSHDAGERVRANGTPADEEAGKGAASRQASPSPSASDTDSHRSRTPSGKPSGRTSTKSTEPTTTQPTDGSDRSKDSGAQQRPAPRNTTAKPDTAAGEGSAAEAAVLTLVNKERAQQGCQPVTRDARLAGFAGKYSALMAEKGFFSHTTPDGRSPWDRAEEAGIDNLAAENIARGQADAKAVMKAWMDSPGHRANILNCDHRTMGVGAHFADGGPWWTQHFGR